MKRPIIYLLLVLLCSSLGVVVLYYYKERKLQEEYLKMSNLYSKTQVALAENIYINSADIRVKDNEYEDQYFNPQLLSNIMYDGRVKLALRIKENLCLDCIDSALKKILVFKNSIDLNRVIIISSYHNTGEVKRLLESRKISIPFLNSPGELLPPKLENIQHPLMFLIDSTLSIKSIFLIKADNPQATETYLKSIKEYVSEG